MYAQNTDYRIEKKIFIPENRSEVFKYWITPECLEKWSAPDGMNLKITKMEAHVGGHYQFVHEAPNGRYNCMGHFTHFVPDKHLAQVDTVIGPNGETLFKDLVCCVDFRDVAGGTEVEIAQTGFTDHETWRECDASWDQCLAKLKTLIAGEIEGRGESFTRPDGDHLTNFY